MTSRARAPAIDRRALLERVDALCSAADRLRLPTHRFTAEQAMIAQDELRAGLRRLRRELDCDRHDPAPGRCHPGM